ncbi:MEMO1 family [Trypanosoma melophagium]|uniref:MEMO1 family n=1 Tax=Trypanosoma melophagium TaxID=715481 RepID=UPI00351A8F06|nr:MEMO1 family [Trypanosoma melophagium]
MSYSRRAAHANSWYDGDPKALRATIDDLFAKASNFAWESGKRLVGVISPHAGLMYSGPTAACVYKALRDYLYGPVGGSVAEILLVGPSHHAGFDGVLVSAARSYESPLGALPVAGETTAAVAAALRAAGVPVDRMDRHTDEAEHSLEMQLPFLAHIAHSPPRGTAPAAQRLKLVPLLVGWTDRDMEERIGNVLAAYAADRTRLFVLSSDFCHWGSRFQYTYHYQREEHPNIGDAIIAMDHEGMDWLEKRDMDGWYKYLARTHNTICGRRPIAVGMAAVKSQPAAAVKFLHYSQSNRCANTSDSSVSYASAVITQG